MAPPRKHHFVPQFYLRRFTDNDEKICVIEKAQSPRDWSTSTENTGAKRDYHTLDWIDREPDTEHIEKNLATIEGNQNVLLKSILENPKSYVNRKKELSSFIALMHLRVPEHRDFIERMLSESVVAVIRKLLRDGKLPEMPDSLKKLAEESNGDTFHPVISNWKIMEFMYDDRFQTQITKLCSGMNFRLLSTDGELEFITSDTPVVLFDRDYGRKRPYVSSFGMKSIQVSIPLSKSFVLVLDRESEEGCFIADSSTVREFNRRMTINAKNYIFMKDLTNEFKDDLSKLWNKNSGSKIDVLDFGEGCDILSRYIPVHEKQMIELI